MEMLVSTRISELKKAVANSEQAKINVLVEEIRKIKNDSLTNRLVQLILDGKVLVSSQNISDEIDDSEFVNEPKELDDEDKYSHFHSKALLNDFIKNKKIKKGISFVSVSMNRDQNLLRALPTWLETDVDEVIIVDWSSKENLSEKILKFNDPCTPSKNPPTSLKRV